MHVIFSVLLRHPLWTGLVLPGQVADKAEFHHVADIVADSTDEAYGLTQNGNPAFLVPHLQDVDQPNPTLTWARESGVTLTTEGLRLRNRRMNDSLRSLSVGDILIHTPTGEAWMVAPVGFVLLDDEGSCYRVVA